MANKSNSGSCNSAPEVIFNYINEFGSSDGNIEAPYGLCPLCLRAGKCFYCTGCIRNGAFTHTKDKSLERFADKKLKAYKINEKKERILLKYDKLLASRIKAENLKLEISQCAERNRLLKECIKQTADRVQKSRKLVDHVKLENERWCSSRPTLKEKIAGMEKTEDDYRNSMITNRVKLRQLKLSMKEIIRKHIKQLVTYIFPIKEIKNSFNFENFNEALRTELQEAQQVMFVQDHWEFTGDSSSDVQYSVVGPCLPADGDYSTHIYWSSKGPDSMPMTDSGRCRTDVATGIVAALSYATQFVMVLSFYLDIHVPKRLCYSEFSATEIPEDSFLHKVAKLNANVIHLCLSQNVEPMLIKPTRTIDNLLLLLDTKVSDLGRIGPLEEKYRISRSSESVVSKDLTNEDDDMYQSSNDDVEQDWVKVEEAYDFDYSDFQQQDMATAGSNAVQPSPVSHRAAAAEGDWMSSVASIWRAATGQK